MIFLNKPLAFQPISMTSIPVYNRFYPARKQPWKQYILENSPSHHIHCTQAWKPYQPAAIITAFAATIVARLGIFCPPIKHCLYPGEQPSHPAIRERGRVQNPPLSRSYKNVGFAVLWPWKALCVSYGLLSACLIWCESNKWANSATGL